VAILRPRLSRPDWPTHTIRVLCGWSGVTLMFAAAAMIPLADATAISFLNPVFCMILAIPLLGERIGPWRWLAAAIALVGALILIRPGAAMEAGALVALGAALLIGLELIFIKRLSGREPPLQILLVSNSIGVLIASVAVIWVWQAPTPTQWAGMAALGLTMAAAQFCFVNSMARADASFVTPFTYLTLVFAASTTPRCSGFARCRQPAGRRRHHHGRGASGLARGRQWRAKPRPSPDKTLHCPGPNAARMGLSFEGPASPYGMSEQVRGHRTEKAENGMSWTDERVELLKKMWGEGQSASQIAKELGGVTRNAVIGKVHRLGLSNRSGGGASTGGKSAAARRRQPQTRRQARQGRRAETRRCPPPPRKRRRPKPRPRAPSNVTPLRKPIVPAGQPLPPQPSANEISPEALAKQSRSRNTPSADADGADRADLQMAHRRPGDRRFLLLRPAGAAGQTLLRGPCRRGVPADERAARPAAVVAARSPLSPIGSPAPVPGP
jgi:uncharacterized membrane protein